LQNELDPIIDASAFGKDGFVGRRTRRSGALLAHAPSSHEIALDPVILGAARGFLEPWTKKVQLMLTQTIAIGDGETAQLLHRDRLAWGGHIPRSIEPQLNTIWAITDFTEQNGATRIVPGSHTWPDDREATEDEVTQAAMSAGSVLVYSGSVIHGGGANNSGETRVGLNMDYCLDWLRQEENQYLCYPPDVARQFPEELAGLIGYTGGGITLGYWSDLDDPSDRGIKLAEAALAEQQDARFTVG
ncbi:MAG: phytanoyl-CoA dioxygenase family protein, partial [Actinomycetota bacterium]